MRVSAFLIFVLLLGCGKPDDSSKGGKGSDVTKAGDNAMKSGPYDGSKKGPDNSMSGSQGAKVTGGTGAKSDTGTGNTSNPAVVKNDAAKPVTPVVKKETPVWDWPVKAKYDIPKCRKLYFHNENLVSDIHRGGKTVMVYRYRDGKLEFKKDIWVGDARNLWALPDGGIAIFSIGDLLANNENRPFLKERTIRGNYLASLRFIPATFLIYGGWVYNAFKIVIFEEKLVKYKVSPELGDIHPGVYCNYLIIGEKSFYFQWGNEGHKMNRSFGIEVDSKTRAILKKYVDIGKYPPSEKGIVDRIKENHESCTISSVDRFSIAPTLHKSLYKNGKRIVTTDISVFDNTTTYKVAAGECLFGKADILITGKNEKNPTSLYDEELKKLIKPHCKKAPMIFINKYRIQNRPGGGFVVNFTIGVKPLDRRYLADAGSYYREYSAEGKPLGPVIKTKSEVEILSENHYRVTEGCHYEYRHRPGKN